MVGLSQDFIPNEENFLPWSWPSDHPVGDWHPNWLGPRLWCTTGSFQQICALRAILPLGRWFQVVPVTMCWTSQQLVTLPAAPEVVQMSDFYLYNQQIVVEGFDQATLGCAWSEYLRCRAFIRLVASFGSLNILWVSEIRVFGISEIPNSEHSEIADSVRSVRDSSRSEDFLLRPLWYSGEWPRGSSESGRWKLRNQMAGLQPQWFLCEASWTWKKVLFLKPNVISLWREIQWDGWFFLVPEMGGNHG
jgi:hypothetical protein